MTPEQVNLVQDGVARLRTRMASVADGFYRLLFERHPDLRPMFPDDLSRLRVKFASELETIVRAIPDFTTFLASARQLGARHVGYGVRAAHYGKVRAVLLEVIAGELQPGWTDADAAAWAAAYDMITEAMQLGIEPARAG